MADQPRPRPADLLRPALPWLGVAVALMVVEVVVHVTTDVNYHRLVIDAPELSQDISVFEGAYTTLGVVVWFGAAFVATFTAWTIDREHHLRPALMWLAALSALLGVDDRMRIHEELANALGTGEVVVFAFLGGFVGWIGWRFWRDLRPEWGLAAVALVALGGSLAFDIVVEEMLGLSFGGEVFIEENSKLVGIIVWFGMVATLSRRALHDRA